MTPAQWAALGLGVGAHVRVYFDDTGFHYPNGLPVILVDPPTPLNGQLATFTNQVTCRVIRVPVQQIQAVVIV